MTKIYVCSENRKIGVRNKPAGTVALEVDGYYVNIRRILT